MYKYIGLSDVLYKCAMKTIIAMMMIMMMTTKTMITMAMMITSRYVYTRLFYVPIARIHNNIIYVY